MLAKKSFVVIVGLLLVAGLVVPSSVLAMHALQDNGKATFSLEREGDAPEQAKGTLKTQLSDDDDGFHIVKGELDVRELPERAGKVYELFFVDNDTGYRLSIGAFQTDNDGDGELKFARKFVHVAEYDRAIVVSQPKHSNNPQPSDEVVLSGTLH